MLLIYVIKIIMSIIKRMSDNSLSCRQYGQPITFDNKHISQRARKKIPLDIETKEPHDCPVRRD